MPLITLHTNLGVAPDDRASLLAQFTQLIADELGKPKAYVQAVIVPETAMTFGGTDAPSAWVDVRAIGLPPDKPKTLTPALSSLLQKQLGIPPERVFLTFADVPRTHWGWNGSTFG